MEWLRTHAAAHSRFGYRRLYVLIAPERTAVNYKRIWWAAQDLERLTRNRMLVQISSVPAVVLVSTAITAPF